MSTTTSFFEKRCPSHRPEWIGTFAGPGDRNGTIGYCALDSVAALAWSANMAALELHAPMARGADIESPTMCVFDLDPGPGTGIPECAEVALDIRDVLDRLAGLECLAKTSGSKGLQLYVPLNTPHTHEHCSEFAQAVAQVLEKHDPKRVTSVMAKRARPGKVFIDWSQNSRHKTTVAVYSLRARPQPTVSTPVTWDEVEAAADGGPLSFEAADVLGPRRRARRPLRGHPHDAAAAPRAARLTSAKAHESGVDPRDRAVGRPDSPVPANPNVQWRTQHMNRRDLVKAISAQTEVDAKTVDAVVKGFTDVVTAVVAKGEPVAITGFAKFAKVERAARMGRNPATGEAIKIKASKKARITPLKGFKDAVMTPSQAPKLNKGVFPPA